MSNIVNGGYAKITKRLYAFELRLTDGASACEFVHASSLPEARARAWNGSWKGHIARIGHIEIEGDNMSPGTLEQAREWLRNPPQKSSIPSRCEPLLDRG